MLAPLTGAFAAQEQQAAPATGHAMIIGTDGETIGKATLTQGATGVLFPAL